MIELASLVTPIQVSPGSSLDLQTEWKIVRVGVVDTLTSGNVNVTLVYRQKTTPSFSFDINAHNVKHLDCSVIESIRVTKSSPQGVYVTPGVPYQTTDSPLGYNTTAGLIQPLSALTPWRLLESIRPFRGSQNSLIVDESVAAAGTGSSTYDISQGIDYALFTGGISDESNGTSPHASYITVTDGNGNLMFKIRGAMNTPFSIRAGPLSGNLKIAWENGDSVAHWFLLNIYEAIA